MLRISHLTLPVQADPNELQQIAADSLGISVDQLSHFSLVRKSIDARKRSDVHYVCTVDVSVPEETRFLSKNCVLRKEVVPYVLPHTSNPSKKTVIVGSGPAGLLCALTLARAGMKPILLERGKALEQRVSDVSAFWNGGELNPESNVQFGEGGAGTFSDGKLTTGTHDPRISYVLESLVSMGAPPEILFEQKPHIGTDVLRTVVKNIRLELIRLGVEIRFESCLTGIKERTEGLDLTVRTSGGDERLTCDAVVLAVGHSARDTFAMLKDSGVNLEQKAFAIGVRIEHRQDRISEAQFGKTFENFPPADYKLACHLPNGRSAFTFCVCPGGQIVAAASQAGCLVTNGMSDQARDGKWINGGLLVGVTPADFGSSDPLAGIAFQEIWEKKAYAFGTAGYLAPAQRVGDFMRGISQNIPRTSTYRPGVVLGDLRETLPNFVTDTLQAALPIFDRKLHGFAHPNAMLVGVETRSSSPIRILRGTDFQSNLRGMYPCGEGAGYAGGIISAAVDGVRVAEAVAL
ncbi:MAG: FAD-binding protein [Evtepia sp.]